jgi:hypothetical protein
MDEIPSPHIIATERCTLITGVRGIAYSTLFMSLLRHFEALLFPQPMYSLVVHPPAQTTKARGDVLTTSARVLLNQLMYRCHKKHLIVPLFRFVALRRAMLVDDCTGPTFRHLMSVLKTRSGFSAARRA